MNQLQHRAADRSTLQKMLPAVFFQRVNKNSLNAVILNIRNMYQTALVISKTIVITETRKITHNHGNNI